MIETSQLLVLMALSKSSSLSEAAEYLSITQSAVSQHIKNLESKLAFPIVSRQGKKLVLTPAGKKIATMGKSYARKFDDLITEIQQENNQIMGGVSLGTLFGIGKSWIAHRMVEFSTEYPDLLVKVELDYPDRLLRAFEARDFDYLILPRKLTPSYAESKLLHSETLTLVVPKQKEFNIPSDITLKELTDLPTIFFEDKDPLFYQWCKSKFGVLPRNIKPRLVINAFGQMLQAVHEGLGIAVIPTHVLDRSFFKDKIQTFGKDFEFKSADFDFIYHSEFKDSLKAETLFNFLHQEVTNLTDIYE
ncbi:MAG: LysR family transcriptional regulator [Halobacteriovoraceae bacterium]|jgi:DNA-binding transcriptional LysR family regulator|nr:LysR family transcriptional regulator [Halobacteriovoraceae bacterium]